MSSQYKLTRISLLFAFIAGIVVVGLSLLFEQEQLAKWVMAPTITAWGLKSILEYFAGDTMDFTIYTVAPDAGAQKRRVYLVLAAVMVAVGLWFSVAYLLAAI